MNIKGLSFYLSLSCFPVCFFSFINILYSLYFDYFLSLDSYIITLILSFLVGVFFYFFGKSSLKKIRFIEQITLVLLVYFLISFFISIPYYLSNYQITFINSYFEAISGVTGTGFTIFENIKYLDPTLILWRSSSQWIGGLYFLIFIILFFSNSQFNYKLNSLVNGNDKKVNPENDIKDITVKIFFLYFILTILIFVLLSMSDLRLFNSLNLSMTLVSAGGFLPTNNLGQIIKTGPQESVLIFSFLLAILNISFIYNLFIKKNILKDNYEDFYIILLCTIFSIIFYLLINNSNFLEVSINVLSSISTSGLSISENISKKFSLYFLFLTIMGGSLISNTSGIKFLRIYILLKASFIEIFKLVKPNNIINQNILITNIKINNNNIKLSFLVFISFFISLFILSSLIMLDNISFENAFKLSILTITNTTLSNIYGVDFIDFSNLLTFSKSTIIIFMIIGKIELISFFLIIKNIITKN